MDEVNEENSKSADRKIDGGKIMVMMTGDEDSSLLKSSTRVGKKKERYF